MKIRSLTGALALAMAAQWPLTAFAAHPLITEDTGTQGPGGIQVELTYDRSSTREAGTKSVEESIGAVLSVGVGDRVDLIVGLPYVRLVERTGGSETRTTGYADSEIAAKWRFHEAGPLSLALRAGLGLTTGDEDQGLRASEVSPSLLVISTYATDSWAVHAHAGYSANLDPTVDERRHLYQVSAALEYNLNDTWRLVSDLSTELNGEKSGADWISSMVVGLIYSPTDAVDFDIGYRAGLGGLAPDHTWQAGLAFRF